MTHGNVLRNASKEALTPSFTGSHGSEKKIINSRLKTNICFSTSHFPLIKQF